MRNYVRKSAEERKKEVAELTAKLEAGVKDVFEDGNFASYLRTMSKFHGYSVCNQILIWSQCPKATVVAGFNDWKTKFHRNVKKGEKGIRIFAPVSVKIKAENEENQLPNGEMVLSEEDEKVIKLFKTVAVFDVSQTEGEPLPEFNIMELDGNVKDYERLLDAIISVSPCDVFFDNIENGSKGYYDFNKIVVNQGMSQEQTLKTSVHEVTHALLHNKNKEKAERKDRATKEVEAESVAFVVLNALGIDTAQYSFKYVATWSRSKTIPELKSSLNLIRATAVELIDSIEKEYAKAELIGA